jgi:serine/threonine protein kinase
MEYCDETLRDFIKTRNAGKLTPAARKRIAEQFLYGVNYLHYKKLLHRDLSLQNVMLKVYADGAVTVKLTDLGLVKDIASTYTRTASEMRGSIRDPSLDEFKNFSVVNEIYAAGHILAYIFTGRESLPLGMDPVGRIVAKCTDRDPSKRYQRVVDVIADVEALHRWPTTGDAPA